MNIKTLARARRLVQTIFLLSFPVTLNFMSPYVIVDGAWQGIVSGSALLFVIMLLTSPLLGRAWCSWVCPAGAIQDLLAGVNNQRVVSKIADRLKFVIWGLWLGSIVWGFALAGFKAINPLHLTDAGSSVDAPLLYITNFGVILIFSVVSLALGRRGACHSICWMAPFMILGRSSATKLKLPGLRIVASSERCTSCKACETVCPMSLGIGALAKAGTPEHPECIQCGECVAACRSHALDLRCAKPQNPHPVQG